MRDPACPRTQTTATKRVPDGQMGAPCRPRPAHGQGQLRTQRGNEATRIEEGLWRTDHGYCPAGREGVPACPRGPSRADVRRYDHQNCIGNVEGCREVRPGNNQRAAILATRETPQPLADGPTISANSDSTLQRFHRCPCTVAQSITGKVVPATLVSVVKLKAQWRR